MFHPVDLSHLPDPGQSPTPKPGSVPLEGRIHIYSGSRPAIATMPVSPAPASTFPVSLPITEKAADRLTRLYQNEIAAYHNWIASAIDNRDFDRAVNLTAELRAHEADATNLRRTIREAHEAAALKRAATIPSSPAPSFNDLA